jgi:iron(III) transport system permease protein
MMEALADFGTVATFGYRTLTEAIYRVWLGMFDRIAATQLASLLLLTAFAVIAAERSLRGRARYAQTHRRGSGVVPAPLSGWRAWTATAACASVLGLAFGVPVCQLAVWAIDVLSAAGIARFVPMLRNTLALGLAASATACLLALVLAYAGRLHPSPAVRHSAQLASMGYALPGSVIAVGVLVPVALVDHGLVRALEGLVGRRLELVLTGSVAALLFAYVVRFLAVSFSTVDTSLGRIPPSLDDAARSLGVGTGATLRRVHLPLMRGGLLTALVLVFVETIKEMPATLLLRPFGLATLAVGVWERTSESMWAEAAVPALAIVAAGLVPVWVAVKLIR